MTASNFKKIIWDHYRKWGRNLPWRNTRDPYAILVSEIMLQQTQVSRVEGYYTVFLKRFPDFSALAKTRTADVLRVWQGLGYNRRALALQRTAKIVVEHFKGRFPSERAVLESLPGIGKGTSGALRAFAFNEPEVFIETNIRRVFLHFFFPGKRQVTDEALERYIKRTLDRENPREWYWALMDYGSSMRAGMRAGVSVGSPAAGKSGKPAPSPVAPAIREANPNRRSAHYKKQAGFSGSDREIRGKILRLALVRKKIALSSLTRNLKTPSERILRIAGDLSGEGFIKMKGNYVYIR